MKIDFKNKKTIIISILCIAIILLICIVSLLIFNKDKASKISKLYEKLDTGKRYSFAMKQDDGYKITMSQKDNDTSIDVQGEDIHTTTLSKDGKVFFINHDEKTYTSYELSNDNILLDELAVVKDKEFIKGKENIKGKKYKYEEYTGYSSFMYSSNIDVENENIKTRFYFEGDELKYIKTIISDKQSDLTEIEMSFEIEENLFNIPEDYSQIQTQI